MCAIWSDGKLDFVCVCGLCGVGRFLVIWSACRSPAFIEVGPVPEPSPCRDPGLVPSRSLRDREVSRRSRPGPDALPGNRDQASLAILSTQFMY